MEVAFSGSFNRAFKRKVRKDRSVEQKFWDKVEVFIAHPFHRSLRTHKLSGNLDELWSFSVEYDLRVIFYFEADDRVVFVDIGSHDEVY